MSRLAVDPDGLTELSMTALSLARDTETCRAEFRCGAAGLAADRFVLMSLDARFEAVIDRLSGLARSLILVADAFARTEATLAASMVLPYRDRFVATRALVAAEVVRLAV